MVVADDQQHAGQLGMHPAVARPLADAVAQVQPQAQAQCGHGQQRGEAQQLACHQQQALALGHRAGRDHGHVDEDARQIEQARKPACHENDSLERARCVVLAELGRGLVAIDR